MKDTNDEKINITQKESYPWFVRHYTNARILGAKLTLREYSEELDGQIICPGFTFKSGIKVISDKKSK
ncbi:MAG: hypothetical protein ACI8ZM_001319 [Crocinitomix sp.]|jgi:hypothetical protein